VLEQLELAWVLVAFGEKGGVQDPALLLGQARLGSQELAPRSVARLSGAGEELLLVEDVRPGERILCQREGFLPVAEPTQPLRVCYQVAITRQGPPEPSSHGINPT